MTLWEVRHDSENYLPIFPTEKKDWKRIRNMLAGHAPEYWMPIPVEISEKPVYEDEVEEEIHQPRLLGDFFVLPADLPVVTEKSWQILRQLIQPQVELLELDCSTQKLWIVNPKATVDCFDKEKSSFARLPTGEYLLTNFLVFGPGCVDELHIFKITPFRERAVFVSDEFKELVEVNNLRGLNFRKISD